MSELSLFSRFINMHAFAVYVYVSLFSSILYDLASTTQWAQAANWQLLHIKQALENYFLEKPSLVWGERLRHFGWMKFHNTTNNNAKGKEHLPPNFVSNAKNNMQISSQITAKLTNSTPPKGRISKTEIRHRAGDQKMAATSWPAGGNQKCPYMVCNNIERRLDLTSDSEFSPKLTLIPDNICIYEVWLKNRITVKHETLGFLMDFFFFSFSFVFSIFLKYPCGNNAPINVKPEGGGAPQAYVGNLTVQKNFWPKSSPWGPKIGSNQIKYSHIGEVISLKFIVLAYLF